MIPEVRCFLYLNLRLMMMRIDSATGTVTSTSGPISLVPKVVRGYTLHSCHSYPNPTALKQIPERRGSHCTRAYDFEHRIRLAVHGIHNNITTKLTAIIAHSKRSKKFLLFFTLFIRMTCYYIMYSY